MTLTLIGDSLTAGWTRHQRGTFLRDARVFGYPGTRPEHIAALLPLDRIKGTAIVMAGVNSFTLDNTPERIAASVQDLVRTVRPHADQVVLCSILPATLWGRNEWPRIAQTNAVLAQTADVQWLDVARAFLNGDHIASTLTIDGVHLTTRGYHVWARELATALHQPVPIAPLWMRVQSMLSPH